MNPKAISQLRKELAKQKLDGLFVAKEVNVSYLSNFKGQGQLLITPTKKILLTDSRFVEQARQKVRSFQIHSRPSFCSLADDVLGLSKKLKVKRLGFEASGVSYRFYRTLKNSLKGIQLVSTTNIIENIRAIKTPAEIKLIKKAASLALISFAFAKKIIKPGKTEIEIARKVRSFMRTQGAEDAAFEIIVASGKRSSLPHAPLTNRKIRKNEPVLVDLGCRISGYNSDLTRMVFLGKIRGKLKRSYEVVYQAQQQAISAVKAGKRANQIDKIARQYIVRAKLGEFFGHATGHGIGREVHENPAISPKNKGILREGMVITVEPGIYLPGLGGVRIEDMVLVTKKGHEVLTNDRYKSI